MQANQYQRDAQMFAVFPLDTSGWDYVLSALPEELGEFSAIFAKAARKGKGRNLTDAERKQAISELGDISWGIAIAAKLLGVSMDTVLSNNLNKLEERKRTNTIEGSGETVQERVLQGSGDKR